MADKRTYPMISEKGWWQLRNQFKKTIPSVVNVSYLKSLLSLNSDQSARNILAPLKQMGIIDADGKPQPRATDWRSDTKYVDVCAEIISEIYPQELLDLFPDTQIDMATARSWFMDTCSLGDNAAKKIASTFSLLRSGEIKSDLDIVKSTVSPKKTAQAKNAKKAKDVSRNIDAEPQFSPTSSEKASDTIVGSSINPSVHIDLQIHISPDATSDQIDSIFASIARHLYGKS